MPSINMIAPRRAERQRLERDMRRLVYLILVELVIAVVLGGWLCTKYFTTSNHIASLDIKLNELQHTTKEIERYEKMTAELTPKVALLNQAQAQTLKWYGSLDQLTQALPQPSYLTSITTEIKEADGAEDALVKIRGISPNQTRVGEIMLRLYTISEFKDIQLHYTQDLLTGSLRATDFEVGAKMKKDDTSGGAVANG